MVHCGIALHFEQAIDMVRTLEPLSGRYATALFVTGIVAAALSSLFPNYVLGPWLVSDFRNVPRRMDRRLVRIGVACVAACVGANRLSNRVAPATTTR